MPDSELATRIASILGRRVRHTSMVSGGDVDLAVRVDLEDGGRVFVKTTRDAPTDRFSVEARGLAWLGGAGALRVPRVLASDQAMLVLEWIDSAPRAPDFDEAFGRGLATLHRAGAPRFGLDHDGYIATLPQPNEARDDWAAFYRDRRIAPMARRASKHFDVALVRKLDRLLDRLPTLVGPEEPPSRLHGDLWSGNLISDERGMPTVVDPSAYGGHREIDLAMIRLFGRLDPRALAAYEEVSPLGPGHEDRVALYQLYPLLVHVCLFGSGYVGSVERVVARYV